MPRWSGLRETQCERIQLIGRFEQPEWRKILSSPAFAFPGKVSFSLYLVHVPVLIACARWTGVPTGIPGWLLLFGMVMAISLPLASLAYRWIELPSIRLGNAPCRRLVPPGRQV